ncbi:4-(cytidine 5'-diphospho)-2-C-methyl-D-erythritol kinase [Shinella daejeonensis]|uniref:4-(cytidine 5'-diphospho)-2-C-methyl-D-erythritol kinase n=1 Tax=Shinella daejeonensis TaxID=659017 RepID=UPI0020C789B1|nr:4-(cytidine 5'-diphospho)-2-C-methyl-D-erythritol kinase [Shinella daejeonensis]MCP8897196.1 4-(cytidine 5'-diphospho)-2-C-methyl-D-erythritol kinase [Shinella daejeonensis]
MQTDARLKGFAVIEPAPAKINLALHVVGQREDGYHLLDSLVTFTRFGDRIALSPADTDRFTLSGDFSGPLAEEPGDNLVIRARDRLRAAVIAAGASAPPVHIHLEKNLPLASGIGGGSADAAATLRGLSRLWRAALPDGALTAIAIGLGADVPMCLASRPLVARGIGEALTPARIPSLDLVLANPLLGVSTPAVFGALASKRNAPLALPAPLPGHNGWPALLSSLRNDLEAPARQTCPVIGTVSEALARSGARFVRMSGAGATCFGLYTSSQAAEAAAETLAQNHPAWFFKATQTITQGDDRGPD